MLSKTIKQRSLLAIASVLEGTTGLAFIGAPADAISLLLAVEPHDDAIVVGRVAGVALLALGVACWRARRDGGGPAYAGTLTAITLYNAGAGLVLAALVTTGKAPGLVILLVAIVHLGMAMAFGFSAWQSSRADRRTIP